MATWYVRTTGSDSNGGTSKTDAFLTISKAMTYASLAAGDTIYVGAGTYRISSAIAPTSMASMTYLYGDVTGQYTGDAGEVIVTNYATNDTTQPAAGLHVFTFASKNYWTLGKLTLICGGTGNGANYTINITGTSANLTFQDLNITSDAYGIVLISNTFGTVTNLTVERCRLVCLGGAFYMGAPASASGAHTNLNIVVRNSVAISGYYVCQVAFAQNTYMSGGVTFSNCLLIGGDSTIGCFYTTGGNSGTYKAYLYNSLVIGWKGLAGGNIADIVEDYNVIVSNTPRTTVTAGTNSKSDNSRMWRFSLGHESSFGAITRPFGEPPVGSPLLTFGGTSIPTDDINGVTRPASGAASVAKALGPFERSNSGTKETTTVRTGAAALKLAGPGYHDFDLPVAAVSTTVTVYGRFDASYGAGTKPTMSVRNGGECGVADATATMTVASGNWEQLSLTLTPTAAGIVTIRLGSLGSAAAGATFFDDFALT